MLTIWILYPLPVQNIANSNKRLFYTYEKAKEVALSEAKARLDEGDDPEWCFITEYIANENGELHQHVHYMITQGGQLERLD
jgi:hypothetical protein